MGLYVVVHVLLDPPYLLLLVFVVIDDRQRLYATPGLSAPAAAGCAKGRAHLAVGSAAAAAARAPAACAVVSVLCADGSDSVRSCGATKQRSGTRVLREPGASSSGAGRRSGRGSACCRRRMPSCERTRTCASARRTSRRRCACRGSRSGARGSVACGRRTRRGSIGGRCCGSACAIVCCGRHRSTRHRQSQETACAASERGGGCDGGSCYRGDRSALAGGRAAGRRRRCFHRRPRQTLQTPRPERCGRIRHRRPHPRRHRRCRWSPTPAAQVAWRSCRRRRPRPALPARTRAHQALPSCRDRLTQK